MLLMIIFCVRIETETLRVPTRKNERLDRMGLVDEKKKIEWVWIQRVEEKDYEK